MPSENRLSIFIATSEIAPLAKTGGLADVTAALAEYFTQSGHDCRVLVPLYGSIDEAALDTQAVPGLDDLEIQLGGRSIRYSIIRARLPGKDFDVHLLRCPELYSGEQIYAGPDEHLRFILLSRVAIEMCQQQQFAPDIFHVHDWHTALVPVYLKTLYAWDRLFADTKTVLTIHNIGYQGVFGGGILYELGLSGAPEMLDEEDLRYDRINLLKTGIRHADLLTTVSPTYAREILRPDAGMGLDGLLRMRSADLLGILNGVDYAEWNPESDPLIPSAYSITDLSGKEANKQAVLEELGLEYVFDRPLVGMITRLTYQKGIDLVQQVLPERLRERDFSMAVLGNGDAHHERFFHWLQGQFPGRVAFYRGFNNALAHRIEAGSDLFLMPSRYEPCGLNQMYSLRYGTIPVVRATGGLADSVRHFDPGSGQGTGIVFHDFDANGLRWALDTALDLYGNKKAWRQAVHNGMQQNYSWEEQGALYEKAFRKLL